MNSSSKTYIQDLVNILDFFPHEKFEKMIDILIEAYNQGKNIFVMGNGGSAATASHWACDINKGCNLNGFKKKIKMICLNDNISLILAYANDLSYDLIFVEQLKNILNPKDVVIGISGSGNSVNVLKAIEYAKKNKGVTIALCGFDGGKLHDLVDLPILIKNNDMQKVEDTHVIIAHMAMQSICSKLKDKNLSSVKYLGVN